MASEVVLSAAALDALLSIGDIIALDDPDRADAYVSHTEQACRNLREFPARGRLRPELGRGIRALVFDRRVTILYHTGRSGVEILHVVWGGRDLPTLLRPEG